MTLVAEPWASELDRAVRTLRDLAAGRDVDDRMRQRLDAASDRLASYAVAVRTLAEAGGRPDRCAALVERGWRDVTDFLGEAGDDEGGPALARC